LVILGQGCVSDAHPASTPTATSQPIISFPPTITPTAIELNADLSQNGWFIYVCETESGEDLCLVSPDRQRIIDFGLEKLERDISSPTWSQDGKTIAFEVSEHVDSDIYTVDINCVNTTSGCLANMRKISPDQPGQFIHPDWSPDGQKIAYGYRMGAGVGLEFNIWVMNSDGTNPTRLTEIDGSLPNWSPDGEEIAFVSFDKGSEGDVFVVHRDGSGIHQLTEMLPDSGAPDWSPDGEWLVVNSSDGKDPFEPSYMPTLFKVRADGSEVIRLSEGYFAAWSPDGEVIAFVKYTDVWFMDVNGMNLVKIIDRDTYQRISWQPYVILPEP
jgi:Tol biopolymer transport system component